ncbi:hypothetical protein HY086_01825 [Candidatus Gottesmanbacteria bacterium]|nr:hypothetical protein [Candidatus Gottesmanbacteria bacterium]
MDREPNEPIVITVPPREPPIEIPGPEKLIQRFYQELQESREQVDKLRTPDVINAMQSIMTISGFAERLDQLPARFEEVRPSLYSLMQHQKTQHDLARNIFAQTVILHAGLKKISISQLLCVYWAGGRDRFVWDTEGNWLHVGLEKPDDIEILMSGRPRLVPFNIADEGLPKTIKPSSVDVSLFKTLGSAPEEVFEKFRQKINLAQKPGGLLVETYDLPQKWAGTYSPYQPLQDIVGTSLLTLNAPMATWKFDHGYFASKYNFLSKK